MAEGRGGTDARECSFEECVANVIESGHEVQEPRVAVVAVSVIGRAGGRETAHHFVNGRKSEPANTEMPKSCGAVPGYRYYYRAPGTLFHQIRANPRPRGTKLFANALP